MCLRISKPRELWIDAGSGTGNLSSELIAAGLRVVDIDHDIGMTRYAKEKFELAGVVAKTQKLPFRDQIADGLVAISLIGCLPELPPFLAEVNRVLKPKANAILTFTNRSSHLHRVNRLFRKSTEFFRAYSISEIKNELENAGLEIKHLRFCNFVIEGKRRIFPSNGISKRFENLVPRFISSQIARNVVVVSQKIHP
ncbi:MAG: hypothetical protein C5B54_06350 [Acidobacteria bacterium]|nr:MAG: hypothetical protein C5B54_06350 [Acidobacteriota bacterium]